MPSDRLKFELHTYIEVFDCGPSFYENLQGKPKSARKEAPAPAAEEEPLTNFVRIDKVGGGRSCSPSLLQRQYLGILQVFL